MELVNITNNTYYIKAPINLGVYVEDGEAILIDSGNDKDAGRKVLKLLNEQGWKLKMIVNTHSNADHIGANDYLQRQTGCRISATRMEAAFINDPIIEPSFLFGAYPPKELMSKFIMAKQSTVTDIIEFNDIENNNIEDNDNNNNNNNNNNSKDKNIKIINGNITNIGNKAIIHGTKLEAFSVAGHFIDMIAVRTPDNVMFIADTVFSEQIINKYHIFFVYDLEKHLQSLEWLKGLNSDFYVPAHAEPMDNKDDLLKLVELNEKKIEEVLDMIIGLCIEPLSFEEILKKLMDSYGLELNITQYHLNGSALKAFLRYLNSKGRLEYYFKDNRMLWKTTE